MRDISHGKTYIYCVRWSLLNNVTHAMFPMLLLYFIDTEHPLLFNTRTFKHDILFLDFPSFPCLPGKLPFSFQNAAQRLPVPETLPWSHLYCFIEFITLSLILFLYLVQTSNVALIILHIISFMYFPLEQILRSSKTCLIY